MGNKTTETARADPYKAAQPMIDQGLGAAQSLFNQRGGNPFDVSNGSAGTGFAPGGNVGGGFRIDPYQGNMVAGLTPDQLRANQMTRDAVPGQMANIQGAQDTVRGVQQQGYYGGFQDAVGNMQNAQETNDFRTGINAAQDTSFDARFDGITGSARGNDARFDATVSRETDPNQTMQMSNALRRSIIEGIAPQISGTFSKSGMANSGLHATNLARGLTSGLAPVEYQIEADNRNRALQAAGMAQGAYESGKQFDLTAGGQRQAALDAGRNRSMAAGVASEGATRDRLSEALRAGQVGQTAMDTNENQALSAAGMMPGLNAAYYDPINRLRDVGQYEQTQQQNEINAKIMRDQQQKNASASAIERYLALTAGVGGQFGTSSGTKTTNPGLLSILGGGMKALSFGA
jgi:hypothetical protein